MICVIQQDGTTEMYTIAQVENEYIWLATSNGHRTLHHFSEFHNGWKLALWFNIIRYRIWEWFQDDEVSSG